LAAALSLFDRRHCRPGLRWGLGDHDMFELLPETKNNIIAIKASGTLTAADYEQFMPDVIDLIADAAPVLAFLDWEELSGWAADAEWYAFWIRATNRCAFERVAIVAGETWQDEVARIATVLRRAEVRRFDAADRTAAWAWLGAR
jgi:SpoIIAA-like